MSIHQKKIFFYMAIIIVLLVLAFGFLRDLVEAPTQEQAESAVARDEKTFVSEATGLSFAYKETYLLRGRQTGVLSNIRPITSEVLVENTEENRDYLDGKMAGVREGPISITVDSYESAAGLSPEMWVKENTNWTTGVKYTSAVEVGGQKGIVFYWDGLYAGKSAVVIHDGIAYVFGVTWMTEQDQILEDYDELLSSVRFD